MKKVIFKSFNDNWFFYIVFLFISILSYSLVLIPREIPFLKTLSVLTRYNATRFLPVTTLLLIAALSIKNQRLSTIITAIIFFPLFSLVSIFVLMSACAASAQGLQNLSAGLTARRYLPQSFGAKNSFDVSNKPVWLQIFVVSICFLFIGTKEDVYLGLYAAGVFIIISQSGWAVTKRLIREARQGQFWKSVPKFLMTGISASLTTVATIIVLIEKFSEGAWLYFVLIPIIYAIFSYFNKQPVLSVDPIPPGSQL
ncbi:MAG: hypothetical protein Q7J07_00345 [Pelolinea sp.]|nr:hypothetical protein [Pelolinea sp.]